MENKLGKLKVQVDINSCEFAKEINKQIDRLSEINKINNTQLAMDYIKDVLIESNDRLFYIYWEEIGFNLDRRQKADIVNTLENKYGYNCKADEKGIFIERYDCIKKELTNMEETKHICESCEIHHYEGNNIYAKLYYDELTEDSYYVLVYDNFYDFIDDALGLMEGNFLRTRELDNDFYMIVLKNVPNIDCDEE